MTSVLWEGAPVVYGTHASRLGVAGGKIFRRDQLDYNQAEERACAVENFERMNAEQQSAFNRVVESVEQNLGKLFFVSGAGGTDKHFSATPLRIIYEACAYGYGEGRTDTGTPSVGSTNMGTCLVRRARRGMVRVRVNGYGHAVCQIDGYGYVPRQACAKGYGYGDPEFDAVVSVHLHEVRTGAVVKEKQGDRVGHPSNTTPARVYGTTAGVLDNTQSPPPPLFHLFLRKLPDRGWDMRPLSLNEELYRQNRVVIDVFVL
ncbi:hypothetical protein B0H13DRAFT_2316031 [Mycena leptocephala]|nr:hypothetical protein B0H13DRAFT_2316031 [Mycena leptocephala]